MTLKMKQKYDNFNNPIFDGITKRWIKQKKIFIFGQKESL